MSSQPVMPTQATLDAEGRVAVDAPCVNCGYNLRTLKADGLCPECAQPVTFSIQGYFLRFAQPSWVRGLARGMVLILIALGGTVILAPLLSLMIAFPVMASAAKTPGLLPSGPTHVITGVQFVGHGLLIALAIIGLVYLTRPDPAQAGRAEGLTARRIVRLCCVLLPVPSVVNLLIGLYMPTPPGWSPGLATAPAALGPTFSTFVGLGFASGLLALVVYAITPVALVRHLIGLLRRLPRPGLVRFARVEFWGLLFSAVVSLLASTLMAVTILPAIGPALAAATTMPSTMPGGTLTVSSWSGGTVSVTQMPITATGTAPASMPGTMPALAALGYATGPATSVPTTLPGMPPFPALPPGIFAASIFAGGAGCLGGCGGLVFGVASVVLLVQTCAAFFKAAREAEGNSAGAKVI